MTDSSQSHDRLLSDPGGLILRGRNVNNKKVITRTTKYWTKTTVLKIVEPSRTQNLIVTHKIPPSWPGVVTHKIPPSN